MQAVIEERVQQYLAALAAEDGGASSNGSSSVDVQQELSELILDGRSIRTVSQEDAEALQKFTGLSKLTLNQTGLASLDGIPYMPSVRTLEATDNHITTGLDKLVKAFPNLRKLQLGGNHIKTFEELQPLTHLTQMEQLGLDLNPVASLPEYRERVFALVPSLQILDSRDRSGEEKEAGDSDSDEEEEEEVEEVDTTLKDFYEGEMPEQDAEDVEDFEPPADETEEDEEIDEEDDGIEEDDEEDDGGAGGEDAFKAADAGKRKGELDVSEAASKLPRHN